MKKIGMIIDDHWYTDVTHLASAILYEISGRESKEDYLKEQRYLTRNGFVCNFGYAKASFITLEVCRLNYDSAVSVSFKQHSDQ